jgi:hypothetical protein
VTVTFPPAAAGDKASGVTEAAQGEPEGIKTRMRSLFVSAMYTLPVASRATPEGKFSQALAAGPLSPLKPLADLPATVVITPFETLGAKPLGAKPLSLN